MIKNALREFTLIFWRVLFVKKKKPVAKVEKTKKRIFDREDEETDEGGARQVGYLNRNDFNEQKLDKHVEIIMEKYENLRDKTPSTSAFLGEEGEVEYPIKKHRFFHVPRTQPNIEILRDEIESFSKGGTVTNPRKKLRKYLKHHPYNPDLRAINGIQIHSDTLQSGLDEKKLDVMNKSLTEIGQAIHNGAISVYYVNWFVKIYVKYLEVLQRKILTEYNLISTNYHWQVQKIAEEMHHLAVQITSMLSIREQLTGLSLLNAKLKGSAYIYDCITTEEIADACKSLEGDENQNVGIGKSPKYILWEVITIATLFARVPMFTQLVGKLLQTIPDTSRMLILQKNMVGTIMAVTDYQFAISLGDLGKKIEMAHRLYSRCVNVIREHLGHVSPKRVYEVDPFLKAAWITKQSYGLFEREEYRKMLEQSMEYLNTVLESPDTVKGSFDIARKLQDDLHSIMIEYGWALF